MSKKLHIYFPIILSGGNSQMTKDFLADVIGYDNVKEELYKITSWYKDYQKYENMNLKLPQGILFYGDPGNGKSFISKQLTQYFAASYYFKIQGLSDINKDISDLFQKARHGIKPCLIIFEEIDLLVRDNFTLLRTLQDEIDGHESNSGILILATCNNTQFFSDAILRDGRFNYMININYPTIEEYKKLFSYFFAYANFSKNEIDILANTFKGSISSLKALKTEAKLRLGMHPTLTDLEKLITLQAQKNFVFTTANFNYQTAIHEAGHIITAWNYRRYFLSISVHICSNSFAKGITSLIPNNELKNTLEYSLALMTISMAGNIASKYYGQDILGNSSDMKEAYDIAKELVDNEGKLGVEYVMDRNSCSWTSQKKIIKTDKMIKKIMKTAEKQAKKIIKANRSYIYKIADILSSKSYLSYEDIKKIMSDEAIDNLNIQAQNEYPQSASYAQAYLIQTN